MKKPGAVYSSEVNLVLQIAPVAKIYYTSLNFTDMTLRKIALLVSCLVFTLSYSASAQDLAYAKDVVKTLCADNMKGRGYVENGDKTAATFIAGEFEKAGLKKYAGNYFQKFNTPVNAFPGEVSATVNGKKLIPGQDFLVEPGSPSVNGSFKTIGMTADELLKDEVWTSKAKSAKGKFLVIYPYDKTAYSADQAKRITDIISYLKYSPENPAKGTLEVVTTKLTWSGSTELLANPGFTIKSETFTGTLDNVELKVENKFYKNYESQNVVGYIEGDKKDSLVVLSAHYDHLGMMGKATMFPGANDNASGIALLLNMARYYCKNKPEYTTVFIAFGGEEIGLIGSKHFTEHPLFPLTKIRFLINFDLAGTGDDGLQVVNGKIYQDKFDRITKINADGKLLKLIKIRGEACNSDHCMFHMKGVPCFYMYTLGGIQAYHDIYDRAETLPLTEFEDYFRLVTQFIKTL
jgi:aminopeptidase YwaD